MRSFPEVEGRDSRTCQIYIFVDPSRFLRGGITAYTHLAATAVTAMGLKAVIIKRNDGEQLDIFRHRVSTVIASVRERIIMVEAPETGATILELPKDIPTHVRLHCSRMLGRMFEGGTIDAKELALEAATLERATLISAPSQKAWRETARLLPVPHAVIYPNPVPTWEYRQDSRTRGVIFLGRPQPLKGIRQIQSIIVSLPREIPVTLAGPGMSEMVTQSRLSDRVEVLDSLDELGVRNVLASAQVALVPSLFETFSMVAAEALACGTPVVCRDTVGIADWVGPPAVTAVQGGPQDFVDAILGTLKHPKAIDAALTAAEQMRLSFTAGLTGVLRYKENTQLMKYRQEINQARSLPKMKENKLTTTLHPFQPTWQRKLRKLVRSPRAFFHDSRTFRSMSSFMNSPPHTPEILTKETKKSSEAIKTAIPTQQKLTNNENKKTSSTTKKSDSKPNFISASTISPSLSEVPYRVIVIKKSNDKLEVIDASPAESQWSSIFFVESSKADAAATILNDIASPKTRNGFAPFSERYLFLGKYSEKPERKLVDTLNCFDLKSKQHLSRFHNAVFLNPTCNVARAVRACHSGIRLTVILTLDGVIPAIPAEEIDVLIVPAGHPAETLAVPRVLRYGDTPEVWPSAAIALRRAVREAGPKPLDAFLPVYGAVEYDPALLDLDATHFNGIIRVSKFSPQMAVEAFNFEDFVEKLSPNISSIMLTESTYLRYRSLCETAKKPADWGRLIALSLKDGARYDVRA